MEVIRTFKDPLSRQIEEAIQIEEEGHKTLNMNSRAESRSTPLPQVGVTQDRVPAGTAPTFQQGGQGSRAAQGPPVLTGPGAEVRGADPLPISPATPTLLPAGEDLAGFPRTDKDAQQLHGDENQALPGLPDLQGERLLGGGSTDDAL